jgi:hypothetical protein
MDQNCRYKDWTLKNKNVAGVLLYCMLAQIAFLMHQALTLSFFSMKHSRCNINDNRMSTKFQLKCSNELLSLHSWMLIANYNF